MKNIVDDPQFTAWLLGELSSAEAEEMERVVAADPALQLAAREQQLFLKKLTQGLGGEVMALDARQRSIVLRSARQAQEAEQKIVALPQVSPFRGWAWASLATAAALVMGIWVTLQGNFGKSPSSLAADDITREIALLPRDASGFPQGDGQEQSVAVGGSQASQQRDQLIAREPNEFLTEMAKKIANDPLPDVSELPALSQRGFISAASHPQAPLPVVAGTASWNWVKRSILERKTLPHPRMVRVEELVNAFTFSEGTLAESGGLEIRSEVLPSALGSYRVLVSLKNPLADAAHVSWRFEAQNVDRYRLIGFASPKSNARAEDLLASGTATTLLLDMQSQGAPSQLGDVVLTVAGEETRVPLIVNVNSSVSSRFFSCLADFGTWLHDPAQSHAALEQQVARLESEITDAQSLSALAVMRQAFALKVAEK